MMSEQSHKHPQIIIQVTKEEYAQFIAEETFLPQCIHLNVAGIPNCEEDCPKELVCAMFTYHDVERGTDVEWYACAPADILDQLSGRAVTADDHRPKRKVKYIAYESDNEGD